MKTPPKFTPTGNRILVLPKLPATKTDAGIIIVSEGKPDRIEECLIIALGDNLKNPKLKVGDRVLIDRQFSPLELTLEGEKYKVIASEDVLGVLG